MQQKNGVAATTQDVLTHHLNCFGDIVGTMADYTAESRFFTPDGVLCGSEAIRRFFVPLFEEFAKAGMSFEMLRQEVEGAEGEIFCSPARQDAARKGGAVTRFNYALSQRGSESRLAL